MNFSKRMTALVSAAAMLTALLPVISASAADTDAEVTVFRQMRCNNNKTNTATATGGTYYSSGYLIDILSGTYINNGAEATRANAEIKTSAREYAVMRITLNSAETESVSVSFSVSAANKTFSAYSLDYADWTEIAMTDFNHVPTSVAAVDASYAISLATGMDWSQKGFEFDAVQAMASDTSESDKLIEYSFNITDEENEAGYKDIVIVNTTSESDGTYIMVGTPDVVTTLKNEEPTATPTAEPTAEPTATPTSEPTAEPTATPTIAPTATPTAAPTETAAPELAYNKFDMARATVYRYNIAAKSQHTSANGGEVNIVDTTRSVDSASKLIDGDEATIHTSGQTGNCASVIDLGVSVPVSKIVVKKVAGSAIIGLADDEGESDNGTVTETNIKLAQNWARLNNGNPKHLTSAIKVEYGTQTDGLYDTVTLTGAFGNSRYVVFDGNGSSTKCGEIEVYYDGEPLPEPTPTPTPEPGQPTPTASPTAAPAGYPDGAIVIKDQPKAGSTGTSSVTVDANGSKRDAAYTNGTGVWYIGNYELANIESIDLRLGLVASTDGSTLPQVRLAYLPLDGSEINDDYINAKSGTIRSSANQLAVIEGVTEPSANAANGHQWLGALYTVTDTGVSVDSAGYAAFPGGNASLTLNSTPFKTDAAEGKVALFVYAVASKCRAAIDYVVVNEKVLTPTELRIDGEDTWIIRDNAASDYETSADDYKAVLISDIGTEMRYNASDIWWSVSGSDYISMKSASGSNSGMEAERELPIGTHTITLTAEYENEDGITLTASKTITVEKRESSRPTEISISGESSLDLLTSQLPYTSDYAVTVLDQFGVEMEDVVIDWTIDGDDTTGYSISDGTLTVGQSAQNAAITITASSKIDPDVKASAAVLVTVSEYPSKLYPIADVLFRKENTAATNMNGPDLEIRNAEGSDRGFSGGLKFDISTLRDSIETGYPINSISIRFTTSISRDGKLVLKPLSNDWDESNATLNSFDNKAEIINAAINSDAVVVKNDAGGVFTLNRQTNGKRMYEGELGDTETAASWQTTLDITDYITEWIKNNPDENEISFLLMTGYNGTAANNVFTKDIDGTYANWSALISKFPELVKTPELLYPAIVISYGEETVTISADVDSLPIPAEGANTTKLSAIHYDPFTEKSDTDIIWSVSGFADESGNELTAYTGISVDEDGVLSVTNGAPAGTVTVRATAKSSKTVYAEKKLKIEKLSTQLLNGSFENIDDAMMPLYWTSHDPDIDDEHNGTQAYVMNQASEQMLANFGKSNDDDGYLSGTHSAEDPTGVYGKRTVKLTGATGITADYDGQIYTHNRNNSSIDGGPDLRVTTGVTYWISQDYHLEDFYQLSASALVGPFVSYEGFQGTTSKKNQFGDTWYIKDGSPAVEYNTIGYDTIRKQITIPQNVNRLGINWGLRGAEGSIYYHNFRMAPQGIDTAKAAVDGAYELKVTGKMDWTSDGIEVVPGRSYTYKFSAVSEASASGKVTIYFLDAEGNVIRSEEINVDYSNSWQERTGEVTAPEAAAYAKVKLENGTGTGSVWYDNIIFTETTEAVAAYVKITSGNDLVVAPLSGETANSYRYTAKVTNQYNNDYSGSIVWELDKNYTGIEIRNNGSLVLDGTAAAGTVVIRAVSEENSLVYAEKTVTVVKKSADGAAAELNNGSFAEYDSGTLLPDGWTNTDRIVSIANGTFDSSISGWTLNYTSYQNSDTSAAMEWDSSTDHTGNNGGSAKIFNADHALGQMQISQKVNICGGNTYNVSVWVKTDHVSSDSNIYASLIFLDENGSTIEENKQMLVFYPSGGSDEINTSDWTKLSGSIYVNPLAVKLRIDMRYRGGANNNNGTVWYDDLVITKQAGMDTGVTYNNSPSLSLTGYGEEDKDVSRTYGEKWDSEPITGISAGQQYIYSTKTQTFNASKGAYLMITYYDELGRELGTAETDPVTGTNSSWETLRGVSTAPLNSSYAVLSLCIDGQGKAWFADTNFAASTEVNATSLVINGADTVVIPSTNRYSVSVIDASGITIDTLDIPMTAVCPSGVSFDEKTGVLTVSSTADGKANITISASYNGLTVTKTVQTLADTTDITIEGDSSLVIPANGSKTVTYTLKNQLSQKLEGSDAAWSITAKGTGISVKDGVLTVAKYAAAQTITVKAEYNGITAEKKVNLTNTAASSGTSAGGGGGGGGGSSSGSATASGVVANNSSGTVMGNFGNTQAAAGGGSDTAETINGEAIIPQPDPTYFTQGMDNIGGFTDIGTVSWAQKAIVALSAVGIVNGKADGKFVPNDNVTRAEFVKMLIGMLEYAGRIDTSNTSCDFADVADDAWYHDSVAIAVNNGIVQGVSDAEFAPDANITRQDMAVMIDRAVKAANLSIASGAELVFIDSAAISGYAKDSVQTMAKAGIINGFDDGRFAPLENATRAQSAVIIYRAAGGEA